MLYWGRAPAPRRTREFERRKTPNPGGKAGGETGGDTTPGRSEVNEKQIELLLALLQLALEMHGILGMDEWLGDEKFENWTKDDTIEFIKHIEEISA